jgi:benzoyl-CoA-dihydrodiol lyase
VNRLSRLESRFGAGAPALEELHRRIGDLLDSEEALRLGLVTFTPDELDWDDELRVAIEERASLSPDALSGMEASLRFAGKETLATKIFGRLSAWQNWIFVRPNAVGDEGALKLFGGGTKPRFNWERV